MSKFIIYNRVTQEYWNNQIGWVDRQGATIFSKEEAMSYNSLPMYGQWVKIS